MKSFLPGSKSFMTRENGKPNVPYFLSCMPQGYLSSYCSICWPFQYCSSHKGAIWILLGARYLGKVPLIGLVSIIEVLLGGVTFAMKGESNKRLIK